MIENYIEDKDFYFTFTGPKLKVYIPSKYIDTSMCEVKDNIVRVFGVLPVELCDLNDRVIEAKVFNFPYMIELQNTFMETKNNYNFFKDDKPMDYKFITFNKGERIMQSTIVAGLENIDRLLDYFVGAKIINYVRYEDLIELFDRNLIDNDRNLGVPHITKELIVAAACRNPAKPEEEFGIYLANNPKGSQYGYKIASNREIVSRSSVSSSVSFEDMDSMIISGINTTAYGKKTPEAPSEKIIKM